MKKRWNTSRHAVFNCSYHLIWCPKYRRKVLVDGVEVRLKELINEKAKEHRWSVKSIEVMPDHVHLFISVSVDDPPAFVISQMKGYSSFNLRKEFSFLRSRLPTLWTRSYYCESVGHISEETIRKYIEEQKNK